MTRPRFRRLATLVAVGLLPAAASASDGEIRLLFDPGSCQGFIGCGETQSLFVYVELQGATAGGITGVEFSIRQGDDPAADPGWEFRETFAPGTTITLGIGSLYPPDLHYVPGSEDWFIRMGRRRGVNCAWAACQTGDAGLVLVETVEITNTGCGAAGLPLMAVDHDMPANPYFRCPLATLCDAPYYTKVCLGENVAPCTNPRAAPGSNCSTSGRAIINPPPGVMSPCRVTAVTPSTWSTVKTLYQR